jgi:RHS repeat-associated protein
MKKTITFVCGLLLFMAVVLPAQATVWQTVATHGTQFDFDGELITITHTTVDNGLDYIQTDFTQAQDVTFEFDARIGSQNNDNFSLVLESDGGDVSDGLWLAFGPTSLYDREDEAVPITLDQWFHYRVVSTRNQIAIYVNGSLKYERAGTFQPRSFLRFRDYGLSSGVVTNYLNNVRVTVHGNVGSHGTQFVTGNNLLKIIHSTTPNGFDYHPMNFTPRQNLVIDFDAKIGSANNDNYSLLMDSNGEAAGDGLRLAFYQNTLRYYYDNGWHDIATVPFDQWSHFRIVSTLNRVEIYVNGDCRHSRTGTFQSRSFVKFKDFGLCSGTVVNLIANFQTRATVSSDLSKVFDDFEYQELTGWTQNVTHGTQFAQKDKAIRIIHSTYDYGLDSIQQAFTSMASAIFEFDAKLGPENNDDFSLLFESDGGYAASGGLGLAFKTNQVMAYVENEWKTVYTVTYNKWHHYRIVSTPGWVAIYVNDDLKLKLKGGFLSRSFMKFSDFGLCSGPVTNYISNVRVRPMEDADNFITYDDFNNTELANWTKETTHGTEISQSSNGIRIIHSTTANGFDNIRKSFDPMVEAVFEFDAKLGPENNDNFSLLVESDGGYSAADGLGLAFKSHKVMTYANGNWLEIFSVPFNEWQHYRIVTTQDWIAIYVNDDLKYKRTGNFRIRSFVKFSDFGLCSGRVTNYLANIQIREATDDDRFIVYDDFNNRELAGWTQVATHDTQFSENSNGLRIIHTTTPYGLDNIKKTFTPLSEAVFEFDAKIGSENNNHFSLLFESDGGYAAANGLGLAFKGNEVMTYFNGDWQAIDSVDFNQWHHYRIVSTPGWIAIYINDDLKYCRTGSFRSRSYIKFSDFGLCSGTVTNYLANVRTHTATENDKFISFDDFNNGTLTGWSVNTPDGTQFSPENGTIKISHAPGGTPSNDYMQRNFSPMQNVVLEFDAKIGSLNNNNFSLMVESNDTLPYGFYLSFHPNWICIRDGGVVPLVHDVWNHYRIVYTATQIQVYVNGVLIHTTTGTFGSRSYFRFSNYGNLSGPVINYIDNVSIRPILPEVNSVNSPSWTSNWTTVNPDGTQFMQQDNQFTINHAVSGTPGQDYLERRFNPLQNVAFEFEAKIGETGNTGKTLIIESDGGQAVGGLSLVFNQNVLEGYFGSWQPIQAMDYNQWNRYRIVSTLKKIQVYVNGVLKYTYNGNFNPRSYLRFANDGNCQVTNTIRNITITPVVPEANLSSQPDWSQEWVVHNPDGTQFIRENNEIRINHTLGGTPSNDYMQRNFSPMQNVILEFDAKIGSLNNNNFSLMVESNDTLPYGFYLSFHPNWICIRDGGIVPLIHDIWNHYRIVYTATQIQVYVNGVLIHTTTGTFGSRSYFRFSNYGNLSGPVINYIDNVSIRPILPEVNSVNSPSWTSNWTTVNPDGTQFIQQDSQFTINHAVSGTPGQDYLERRFNPLQNVAFEFEAKIGEIGNTGKTLMVESDGGQAVGGLSLVFNQNVLEGCFGSWQPIQAMDYNQWNRYRIVSTLKKVQVYVNGVLKYTYNGNFNPRSYLRFTNNGSCQVTNTIRNITITPVVPEAILSSQPDWSQEWVVHNPDGTQFIRENNEIRINHTLGGTPSNDYIQRNFSPMQNVVLEFDAKIGSLNNNNFSLMVESNDTLPYGFYLSFYPNYVCIRDGGVVPLIHDIWNHYRIVYTATQIQVYVNGVLIHTTTGTFGARSYFRFSNYGNLSGPVINYIDNVSIRPILPVENSANEPDWTSSWTSVCPNSAQFIQSGQLVTIHHVYGIEGQDYLERRFNPLQNVAFEFEAKIGGTGNTGKTLIIESDGGTEAGGLTLRFNQDIFEGNFGGWQTVQTINYDGWNRYRIVTTLQRVQVYVNGILKYSYEGSFNPRSFLRFSNGGDCPVTNYIRDISVTPVIPEATITDHPDWPDSWVVHNPEGTQFIRENGVVKINHTLDGTPSNDYIQHTFEPMQNVVLEFDAKIGSENNNNFSLMVESDDTQPNGFYLSFYPNWICIRDAGYTPLIHDVWNHYRLVYTATQIHLYVNGDWKYTTNGTYGARSYFRFSNHGYLSGPVSNYIDNVCIRPYVPADTIIHPPGLPSDWEVHNPDGTQFSPDGDTIRIDHANGSQWNDYIQRNFESTQNVVFEFDAKIGSTNNNNYSLTIESNGRTDEDGLFLSFYQNILQRNFDGQWEDIGTVSFDKWHSYRIISTATEISIYIDGVWKCTKPGSYSARSFLRFSNAGYCNPTNYIANVRITPLALWNQNWYVQDTIPPVLMEVLPANNTSLNTATITVSGKVLDDSPVTVTVNGSPAFVTGCYFSADIPVNEGNNTVVIQATDSASNASSITRQVHIDSVAPAGFTPVADSPGWTSNNLPVVTFSTTDSGDGISHYEIAVGDGAWITPVTSPYTFTTPIPDGEQTIRVKAVDLAGNYTIGTVTVKIDTLAPAIPAGYEVISGINRVIINWQDPLGEVNGFRLYRTPAYTGTPYRDVLRTTEGVKIEEYIDTEVEPDLQYSYGLAAIDRAGNLSATTAAIAVTVGIAAKPVDSNGGTVKFDLCEIAIDKDAFSESYQVEAQQYTIPVPVNEFATAVGSRYDFTIKDANGQEIHPIFESPVILKISYADLVLPPGFTAQDLGIYWHNREGGYWEKLGHVGNDLVNKVLSVQLQHFSGYQVMASQYSSPDLESYYKMGLSPFQSYFQNNIEYVSPSSGNLTVTATDLTIPGPGGLDLSVRRIYDTTAAENDKYLETNQFDPSFPENKHRLSFDSFGYGWSMAIPGIKRSNTGDWLCLPEGQTVKIEWSNNRFEYHEGVHFTLTRYGWWVDLGTSYHVGGYDLTMNDGTAYHMDEKGKTTSQTDPSGQWTIQYAYNGRELVSMTDSINRTISFLYADSGTKRVIQQITFPGQNGDRTITYGYDTGGHLTSVTDPLAPVNHPKARVTSYHYKMQPYSIGSSGAGMNNVKNYSVNLLEEIIYPTTGISQYDYTEKSQKVTKGEITYYGQTFQVEKHTLQDKVTLYTFNMNIQNGEPGAYNYIAPNSYVLSSTVTDGNLDIGRRVVTETYRQLNKRTAYHLEDGLSSMANYKGNLLLERQITNNGNPYETVKYGYDQSGFLLRSVNFEDHYRGGNLSYSITNTYSSDNWGNLVFRYDSSRNLTESWIYHDHSRIKQLVDTYTTINRNPVDNSQTMVTTTYQYNDTFGKPTLISVTDGGTTRETSYTYYLNGDLKGNLQKQTSPNGLETEFSYDSHRFPLGMKYKGVKDADGQLVGGTGEITYQYEYDYQTGLKTSETDGLGRITTYAYDKLNRVIQVTLPDDNSSPPSRQYVFDDTARTCEFYNEKGQKTKFTFDVLGRLTKITKYAGTEEYSNVLYHYDPLGRIGQVTDPRNNITSYQYDGLNRVTRVNFPGGAFATLSYNDIRNTVTITDENGGVTEERSDWAGRLIAAKQECYYSADATTVDYNWSFDYDSLGNRVRQTDPLWNQSTQKFDGFSQLVRVEMPGIGVIKPGQTDVSSDKPKIFYEYDSMGQKTAEISPNGSKVEYEYDRLGRLVKVTTVVTDSHTQLPVAAVTRYYYDAAGNKTTVKDARGKKWEYRYTARNFLKEEEDPEGHIIRYQYDDVGNKTAVSDPRNSGASGDPTFTTWYIYDDLNRLVRTVLPDSTPFITITYDEAGNKLTERDVNGLVTSYTYDSRNRVTEVKVNGQIKSKFTYDAKGNRTKVESVSQTDGVYDNVVEYKYDSLDRLRKTIHQLDISEEYGYDALGNKIWVKDGRGNQAQYTYNAVGWLTAAIDPLGQATRFVYDPNGNRVRQVAANGLTTTLRYDELNRLVEKIDSLDHSTQFGYDLNGNRNWMMDARNSEWQYSYSDSNRLTQIQVTGADSPTYTVNYQYDAAGNRTQVSDNGNTNNYTYDELSRPTQVERTFDNATYTIGYQYSNSLLTGIKYPGTTNWLNYNYNNLNQLAEVVGFTAQQGITYDADGALKTITYGNGVVTSYSYDANRRLSSLTTVSGGTNIQDLAFTYDKSNNITAINNKTYEYDANSQLTKAVTPGSFMESKATPGDPGFKAADFTGTSYLIFGFDQQAVVRLDYEASSIGLDFGIVAPKVKKIQLIPGASYSNHRIVKGTFDLYTSNDNTSYTAISRDDWDCVKDGNGVISITFNQAKAMRYLKIHVWFDDRDSILIPNQNRARFLNQLTQMLRVYQEADSRTEEYQYDKAGNRKLSKITLVQADYYESMYYANSDRLKTDGKNAFEYDAVGNLVKKGNRFTIYGDNITFTTSGEGVEYWTYKYDLLNRLTGVRKNGTIVGEYGYDPEGLRVIKKVYRNGVNTDKIHYVFEGLEPIFEKRISDGRVRSYVYALGNHLARVDGVIGDTNSKKYWYHTDHVGSVKAVTNQTGDMVWDADYLPFGQQYMKNKLDSEFEEDDLGFTGKGYDTDVGLYYFNARWYDADTGRFISEDPVGDPSNPNLYTYCRNNPLSFTDPTGKVAVSDGSGSISSPWGEDGDNSGEGGGGNTSVSINIGKDGRVKSVRYTSDEGRTTIYYNKDGSISRESTIDYNSGLQTLTYYHKNGAISETTFDTRNRDEIVGYRKWTSIAPRSVTAADYFQFYADKELNAPPVFSLETDTSSAPARDDELWNGNLRLFNNCITYFLNRLVDPEGNPWPDGGLTRDDLTRISGIEFDGGNMHHILTSKRFCDYFNINVTWVPIDPNTKLPVISFTDYLADHPGTRQGAYFYWNTGCLLEFHFIRQDDTGYWSWKEGGQIVNDRDNSNNLVADPRFAKIGSYEFGAFIYVSPRKNTN